MAQSRKDSRGYALRSGESARDRTDGILIPIRIRITTDRLYMRPTSSAFVRRNNKSEETLRTDWILAGPSALQSIRYMTNTSVRSMT